MYISTFIKISFEKFWFCCQKHLEIIGVKHDYWLNYQSFITFLHFIPLLFIQQMLLEKLLCWLFAYCLFALFPPFIELLGISAGWKPAHYFSRLPVSWLPVRFCQWEALIGVSVEDKRTPSHSQLQEMPPRVAWQRGGEELLFRQCPFWQQKRQYLQ